MTGDSMVGADPGIEVGGTTNRREELHRAGHPVIEIFGPVVQGEGPAAGRPCHFVRFGGCDYRCGWCDSLYAVDPEEVRKHATRMTPKEIHKALTDLTPGPDIVVLSGGNPALHELGALVAMLQTKRPHFHVHVETQGSVWRPWLSTVDQLVVSPKPPSSGMDTPQHRLSLDRFMTEVYDVQKPAPWAALKIVVADENDYMFARSVHLNWPEVPFYMSVCTPQGDFADDTVRKAVSNGYRWLCERAAPDKDMGDVVLLPQLHVIAHGTKRGV